MSFSEWLEDNVKKEELVKKLLAFTIEDWLNKHWEKSDIIDMLTDDNIKMQLKIMIESFDDTLEDLEEKDFKQLLADREYELSDYDYEYGLEQERLAKEYENEMRDLNHDYWNTRGI